MTERFKPFCAVFLVLERKDEVLLQRRNGTGWMDGYYSLPSGHPEDGETMTQAMIREAKEEIRSAIEPDDLTLLHTPRDRSGRRQAVHSPVFWCSTLGRRTDDRRTR